MTCTRCGDATDRRVRVEMKSPDGTRHDAWHLCKSCEIYVWAMIELYARGHGREAESE